MLVLVEYACVFFPRSLISMVKINKELNEFNLLKNDPLNGEFKDSQNQSCGRIWTAWKLLELAKSQIEAQKGGE